MRPSSASPPPSRATQPATNCGFPRCSHSCRTRCRGVIPAMVPAWLAVLGDRLAGERAAAELARRVLGHGRHGLVDAGAALGADLGHDPLRAVVDDAAHAVEAGVHDVPAALAGEDPGL